MKPQATDTRHILETLTPLHNGILVKHLEKKGTLSGLIVIRENSDMMDMVGDGMNGEHNDNRRVGLVSKVLSVGGSVLGVKKGDVIMHTAWNDLPAWLDAPKGYAMIREADVWGHYDGSEYTA
jgi:co-chaperonin GroES (HSP10)